MSRRLQFEVKTSRAAEFAVKLRIPAWAEGASVSVNGKREAASAGIFARVEREWKNGDRIELELPLKTRLEAMDPQHRGYGGVAGGAGRFVCGHGAESPKVTRAQLLAAEKTGAQSWQVETAGGRDQDAAVYRD